jgi:hypothetical protein
VRVWNDDFDRVPDWNLPPNDPAPVDLAQLRGVIADEKQRVRQILRRAPRLSEYLRGSI